MKKLTALWAVIAVLAFFASPAVAKDDKAKDFVKEAAQGGLFEVDAGNLAMKNGATPKVKDFGKMMVDDHGKANQELIAIAQSQKIPVPKGIGDKYQDELKKLEKLSGEKFDRTYADMMVKDHEEDVAKFKKMSGSISDPQLKAWIEKTLPVLEKHLQAAQQLKNAK